jgi:hypothetical protein
MSRKKPKWDNTVDLKKSVIAAWSPMTSIIENYPKPFTVGMPVMRKPDEKEQTMINYAREKDLIELQKKKYYDEISKRINEGSLDISKPIPEQIDDSFKQWDKNVELGIGKKEVEPDLDKEIDELDKKYENWEKLPLEKRINKIRLTPFGNNKIEQCKECTFCRNNNPTKCHYYYCNGEHFIAKLQSITNTNPFKFKPIPLIKPREVMD